MRAESAPRPASLKRKHAEKVLESAAKAIRDRCPLRVAITELAGGGKEHMFACLDVDAAVQSSAFAGELDLWERRFLAGRQGKS